MTTATLFFNLTPNGNGGVHYAPNGSQPAAMWASTYIAKLKEICDANPVAHQYIDIDIYNYNFTNGIIDLDFSNFINLYNPTYIAITHDNGKKFFYFVDNYIPTANGYRLIISADLWATYIAAASITKYRFTRSNLNLDGADSVLYTARQKDLAYGTVAQFDPILNTRRENIRIIAAIKYTAYKQLLKFEVQRVNLFEFDPHDLLQSGETVTAAHVYKMLNRVANIYATNFSGVGLGDAEILRLYIVPYGLPNEGEALEFSTVDTDTNGQQGIPIIGELLKSVISDGRIPIYNGNPPTTPLPDTVEINHIGKPIYFGTKYNGIKLPLFVGEYNPVIRFQAKQDALIISALSGEESRDITDAFEVPTVVNSGTLTALEKLSKWVGIAANLTAGVAQITSGGAGVISGGLQIASTLSNFNEKSNGTYIGGGDGLITFFDAINDGTGAYIYLSIMGGAVPTNDIEIKDHGAQCEYMPNTSDNLFTYLNLKSYLLANTENIFIACTCTVDNVPYDACEAISGELAQGVKLILI